MEILKLQQNRFSRERIKVFDEESHELSPPSHVDYSTLILLQPMVMVQKALLLRLEFLGGTRV